MAQTITAHELYSVCPAAQEQWTWPGHLWDPSPVPHSLCLGADFEEKQGFLEERCFVAHEKVDNVSRQLRQALLHRGSSVRRPSSCIEASMRAPSRGTMGSTSKAESRLSFPSDRVSSRTSGRARNGADSRQSRDRGDSRLSMRTSSRLSTRTSDDESIESVSGPSQPSSLGHSLRRPCSAVKAAPDVHHSPGGESARSSRMWSVQKRQRRVNDDEFLARNREKANHWITDCNPHGEIHDSQKEAWVIAKQEREAAELLLRKSRLHSELMPFEDWLEDVKEVERAVLGCSRHRYEQLAREAQQAAGEKAATDILQKMSCFTSRGHLNKKDREIAQQVALARLRRHWAQNPEHQKDFDQLAGEVRSGACTLAERDGVIVRLVSVVAFKIASRGCILTELGSWKNGKGHGAPRLPGTKQYNFERAEDTVGEVMNTFLAPLQAGFELGPLESSEYTETSDSFGVATVYHKSTQHVAIADSFVFPNLPMVQVGDKAPSEFGDYRVFCLRQRTTLKLLTWLKPADLGSITRWEDKPRVQKWINSMKVDAASALHDLSWTHEKRSDVVEVNMEAERGTITTLCRNSFLYGLKRRFKTHQKPRAEEEEHVGDGKRGSSQPGPDTLRPRKDKEATQAAVVDTATSKSIATTARVLRRAITREMCTTSSNGTTKDTSDFSTVLGQCQEEVMSALEKRKPVKFASSPMKQR